MKKRIIIVIIFIIVFVLVIKNYNTVMDSFEQKFNNDRRFSLLSSPDNKELDNLLYEYAAKNDINLTITHADDLEAIEMIESSQMYDAVWMSNSVWLYMVENANITNSKSININPVVFGIKRSKAEALGFIDNDVYNVDILNAIKKGKLKYVMSSVVKTNAGKIAYLGFLNSLSGSPEILTSKMLNKESLAEDLKALFSGVERVSGDSFFLEEMFLNSNDYEAVVATESSLISINKQLMSSYSEPLYLIYPKDGVAINDSPFAYVDYGQNKEKIFNDMQAYLLSNDTQHILETYGKRTWYGGTKENADKNSFKKEWGIDTTKYLIPLKYPSKEVMKEAIRLYIEKFRKPTVVAFCLDYSGSMNGSGEKELEDAMSYILDYNKASEKNIQFSKEDKIYVLPFSSKTLYTWQAESSTNTKSLINRIKNLEPNGSTNIYDCSIDALKILNKESNKYTKNVILMSDGGSNRGTYESLMKYYKSSEKIPIYGITFGASNEEQLIQIANLSNAKVFDGRYDLVGAFQDVRGYN